MKVNAPSSALFICFDFTDWTSAKSWSYVSSYLLYHQAAAKKTTSANLCILNATYSESEINHVLDALPTQYFYEYCFVWLPHSKYSLKSIETIKKKCSNLIFILTESLVYSKKDITELPHLAERWREVESLLSTDTPVISFCPSTFRRLRDEGYSAYFSFGISPEIAKVHHKETTQSTHKRSAIFAAALYNDERKKAYEKIKYLLDSEGFEIHQVSDNPTQTGRFETYMATLGSLDANSKIDMVKRFAVCAEIANLRRDIWSVYMHQIMSATVVITLPSYFKGIPGRVIEAVKMEVPVVFYDTNLPTWVVRELRGYKLLYFGGEQDLKSILSQATKKEASQVGVKSFEDSISTLLDLVSTTQINSTKQRFILLFWRSLWKS